MQQVAPALNRSVCYEVQQVTLLSPVPDPLAWAVDPLSLPWENLDVYAHCKVYSQLPTVLVFKLGSYSQVPLMATDQPLLTN